MSLVDEHARGTASTVTQGFRDTVLRLGDLTAVTDLDGITTWSWNELRDRVDALAGGLVTLGLRRGDTVALLLSNRPEFHLADLAVLTAGATPFSIYPTFTPPQMRHLLIDSGATVIITEAAFSAAIRNVTGRVDRDFEIIVVDGGEPGSPNADGVRSLQEVMVLGRGFDGEQAAGQARPEDVLTIIYTSGTTGHPKGVQLTHRNMVAATRATMEVTGLPEPGRALSWLPAAHVAERHAHHYLPILYGLSITTCADAARLGFALSQVRPHWFFAVPRVWEKFKASLESQIALEDSGRRHTLTNALDDALRKVGMLERGEVIPAELQAAVASADAEIFAPWRRQLGLHETLVLNVGAAPTPRPVLEFFHAIGLPVAEMWAMSETCGTGSVNRPGATRIGTAGQAAPGVEIRVDDGEVLVRGDVVMLGYRNQPEETAAAIDNEGWLRTGDLGRLDDGYLTITGRKKEIMINSSGKNMSPTNIESELVTAHPLIGQAVCVGDGRPYNCALITLDADYAPAWARQHDVRPPGDRDLATNPAILETVAEAIRQANRSLARFEQVKRFAVVPGNWLPGSEEMTPTMKLRRQSILNKYCRAINSLYGDTDAEDGLVAVDVPAG